jgi:hypothetical protein
MVVHNCKSLYLGDIGRSIVIWGQPWAKMGSHILTITKAKTGKGYSSSGRASVW